MMLSGECYDVTFKSNSKSVRDILVKFLNNISSNSLHNKDGFRLARYVRIQIRLLLFFFFRFKLMIIKALQVAATMKPSSMVSSCSTELLVYECIA